MNELLAEIYGTGVSEEEKLASAQEDLEATAQMELMSKLAAEEGIDINALNDEQVAGIYQDVFGGNAEDNQGLEKEAEARVKEADFLGRVMAHSYTDELGAIAKEAGIVSGTKKTLSAISKYHRKGAEQLSTGLAGVKSPGKKGAQFASKKGMHSAIPSGMSRAEYGAMAGKGLIRFTPHVAAAGAAGYGAHRALKKESEPEVDLMEAMAIDRANNFLAGYIDNAGNPLADAVEEVKVATPQVNEYVDALAVQLLVDNGYGELLNTEG